MSKTENQLALQTPSQDSQPPRDFLQIVQKVIDSGVTAEGVNVVKELLAMQERIEDRNAKKEYAAALVDLQSETGKIPATKGVPDNDRKIRYHFAPYEDLMDRVQPLLTKYGFAMSFNTREGDGKVTAICTLTHRGGHSEANEFTVRTSPPPKTSPAQQDGATFTYAKRFALIQRLNLVTTGVDNDADGRIPTGENGGETVSFKQAAELREWAENLDADIPSMLKWAGADSFENIPASRYEAIVAVLKKKEAGK